VDLTNDDFVIGICGRLVPMKGHKYLFRAVSEILSACPNIKVVVIGDGPMKHELMKTVNELGIHDVVRFFGYRTDAACLPFIFDVAVNPSISGETFGNILIEAMACRKPVIASDFSGFKEVVADGVTGILTEVHDTDAIAMAIKRIYEDEALRKIMGEAGYDRVQEFFTIELMNNKTSRLYQNSV
jgi:glycosyltransferase involved in cell wall biosynthesis